MAVNYTVTLQDVPDADQSGSFQNIDADFAIPRPDGRGWSLEYSFKGNIYIFHVWKRGYTSYDGELENTWTGRGDDIDNKIIGDGQILAVVSVAQGTDYVDAQYMPDSTYIYGGKASWKNSGDGDAMSVEVIAMATPLTSLGGSMSLVKDADERISWVGDGNGEYSFAGTPTVVDNKTNTGHWSLVDGQLVPSEDQTGRLDLYNVDMTVARLLNYVSIDNESNGYTIIESTNAWKVLPGYKFRYIIHNNSGSTNLRLSFVMSMIRKASKTY